MPIDPDWYGDPDNAELYQLIGQSVIMFSIVESAVVSLIVEATEDRFGGEAAEVAAILTIPMPIPAMIDGFGALLGGNIPRKIDRILKRILDLNEKRNDLVHASWAPGLADAPGHDYERIILRRKSGIVSKNTFNSQEDIQKFRDDCAAVVESVLPLLRAVNG